MAPAGMRRDVQIVRSRPIGTEANYMKPFMIDSTTAQFLDYLHRGGQFGYWWTSEGKRSAWWPTRKRTPPPAGRRNVYVGVHPTDKIPTANRYGKTVESTAVRAQLPIIAAINCLFAEYDAKDFGGSKERTRQLVEALDPAPSAVVDSGGGYHCYWLLESVFPLVSPNDREKARTLQAAWVTLMDGDPQSKDLARVLRVPGTTNYKYDPPRPVAFVQVDMARRYDIAELAALAQPFIEPSHPPANSGNSPAAGGKTAYGAAALRGEIEKVQSVADGLKHGRLLKSAIALGGLIPAGALTEEEIIGGLEEAIRGRAEDFRGAQDTIRCGIAYGIARPRIIPDRPASPNGRTAPANGRAPNGPPQETQPARRSDAIIQALAGLGYTFRLNLCSDTIEVNGQMMDDVIEATIYTQMRDIDIRGRATMRDTWITEAARHAYHPIKEYLTTHTWDGGPHIERLSACLACADPPVVYPDGSSVSLTRVYLWRWLIGAVAKVFDQAQNLMLVIAGPQGTGKSHLARWLCSGIPRHFIEAPITVGDRDTDVRLMNHFLWEVSELDATTRKADVAALKAFITKQVVTARKAYGHHDTVKPACANLIGTVNNGAGFLADETGNRRFYVTTVSAIDWSYTQIDVNQLWAQAVALYRHGEPWQLQPDEYASQSEVNRQHEVDGLLEDWIDRHFVLDGSESAMSAAEIIDHLRMKHEIRLGGSERAQAMEVARVMVKFGISRRQRGGRGVREYVGVWPKNP